MKDTNEIKQAEIIKNLGYALLLFLPTLYWGNENYFLLLPLALLVFNWKDIFLRLTTKEWYKQRMTLMLLIAGYMSFSLINKLMFGLPISCARDYYASFFLFPLLLLIATELKNMKFALYYILLIVVEVIFCFMEYIYGTRSFFMGDFPPIDFSSDFIYDYRVFGLSVNSSVVSFKILAALLLLETCKLKNKYYYAIISVLFIGAIITFNRALILAILFFYILSLIKAAWLYKLQPRKILVASVPLASFFVVFHLFTNHNILTELQKNKSEKNRLEVAVIRINPTAASTLSCSSVHQPKMLVGNELDTNAFFTKLLINKTSTVNNTSGRTLIWANYIQFIDENLWFGNGSDKLYFRERDPKTGSQKLVHAHNSFLEILGTNGILLTLVFLGITFLLWKRKNLIFLLTLLFFSIFQYGIFWGISTLDVVWMIFLLSPLQLYHERS